MDAGEYYSVPEGAAASPGQAQPNPDVHFQCLGCAYGSSRAHLIHTVSSADDANLTAPMAILVQDQVRRERGADEEPLLAGTVEVLSESKPRWVVPEDIAPTEALMTSLVRYRGLLTEAPL